MNENMFAEKEKALEQLAEERIKLNNCSKQLRKVKQENKILKDLAKLIKAHKYSGGITDIELDEGTEDYEIVEKALGVVSNE